MSRINESFKYFSIIDGASLSNEDTSGDPEYYGYTRPGGSWVIMEYSPSLGTYAFFLGVDIPSAFGNSTLTTYDTAWTNRPTNEYRRAGQFKAL